MFTSATAVATPGSSLKHLQHGMERSDSVVECLTRDRGAADSSLTSLTALCPWARHINPSLVLVQRRKTRPSGSRTKHPGTKHPMPFFATPDKTSHSVFVIPDIHPMLFLSTRTKHPMSFLPPRTKHPTLRLLFQGKSHLEPSSTITCTSSDCPSKTVKMI